jgi:ABC-2 type transport system permease protein
MRGYRSFFASALQAHMHYSGALLLNLLATGVAYLITLMIWHYAMPDPAEAHKMFAYLTLGFCLNYSFNIFLERTVGERIREGLIATDLLKPLDFQLFYLIQALSDVVYQGMIAAIVLAVGLAVLGAEMLPVSAQAAALALLSLCLAFFVQYGICFIFVQMVFLTNTNYGSVTTRQMLFQVFSGSFAPLAMYPAALKNLADLLPFKHVLYTPVAIYSGRISGAAIGGALLDQILWALALTLLGRFLFSRIALNLSIQGG